MKHSADGQQLPASAGRSRFRADINGLRALAILTVLAFHFAVPGFGGGFVGVDVFFVISGYLMTGIVVGRLESSSFSVLAFYEDRLVRIYPALSVLLVVMLALGAIMLAPMEYAVLGKNTAMSAIFASNLRFRTDYFGDGIDQEWLLHTWSLSVEWQFYMLFPLAIMLVWRLGGRRWLPLALIVASLVSLAISWWLSPRMPTAAFYLLPTRAWEMMAGGLVWLLPPIRREWSRAAQLAGFAVLGVSVVIIREAGWPGLMALLPVSGTALVIAAHRDASRITGNFIAQWIGTNSYSIYLWHWPVALWLRREAPGDWRWILAGLALSFVLGHLSYRLVETPSARWGKAARGRGTGSRAAFAGALVMAAVILAAGGRATEATGGWLGRFDPAVAQVAVDGTAQSRQPPECFSVVAGVPARCVIGTGPASLTLIGDSHAAAAFDGLALALRAVPAAALSYNAYASCPPILGAESTDPQSRCRAFNDALLAPLAAPRKQPVVLVAFWQAYLDRPKVRFADGGTSRPAFEDGLTASTCKLARGGPTYLMLPWPQFAWRVPYRLQAALVQDPGADDIGMPAAAALGLETDAQAMLRRVATACGARLLDPAPLLCRNGRCLASHERRPLYYDRHHLSVYGSERLAPLYAPLIAEIRQGVTGR